MSQLVLPRRQHQVLDDIVSLAFDIMARPAGRRGRNEDCKRLAAEVAAAIERPMPDERFVAAETTLLLQALAKLIDITGGVDGPDYVRWAKIAGVLLPDVHAAAARAFAIERSLP
ncbi:hypothetical protein RA307_30865 [Xanthobacteraceae bacterium Astr-EGSB]|uniref:hypothetical protein n=1 Tax=Astrobacterium formosum TaxID=3069710 RepID=UPI0027B1F679|nr:hypothetical protein [Xanthobacteraceae bacterium Astr-EGSB]